MMRQPVRFHPDQLREVLALVESHGEVTAQIVATHLRSLKVHMVRSRLNTMVKDGRLYKESMGNGKPTWYGLA